MEEIRFNSLQPGIRTDDLTSFSRPGLWGRMVQLAGIFTKVHDLHRVRVQGQMSHQEAEKTTYALAADLDRWACGLPADLLPTSENMERHAEQNLGSAFVALHLGYYHYTNLLYFPFLDLNLEHTPTKSLFADRCKQSAAAFSDFLALSDQINGCEVIYFIVAHMTIVSSAALLHVLLFADEAELPPTRKRLEANFKKLVKLRSYWPASGLLVSRSSFPLDLSDANDLSRKMERLFTFQRACMRTTVANTHKADSWMMEFLLDHARPIAEKVDDSPAPDTTTSHMLQRDRVAEDTLSLLRA